MPDLEFRSRARLPLQADAADIEAFLLAKDPTASARWDDMGKAEHARAFTAAGTAGTDIVDDLYFALVDNIANRGSEEDFAKLVTPTLKQKGWLGGDDGRIAYRVALIYDTNLRVARASGRWTRYQASKAALPYVEAFTAEDDRVRHPPHSKSDHTAFDGIVLPIDHPFVAEYWTPLGFRCRCGWRQLTRSQLARRKLGITSDAELESRRARIGPPVFQIVAPIEKQLAGMVGATNGSLMPGMPPVDPTQTQRRGEMAWTAERQNRAWDDLDEALAKLFGMDKIPGRRPMPRVAQEPEPAPIPEPTTPEFRSPINASVTAETIKVEPRLAVQKRLRAEFAEAARDPRYSPTKEFRDRTEKDFGNATFSTAFEDNTVSMIGALKPELDDLAKQIGIPPLRGFKPIGGGAGANQGDGVMGINPQTFNRYAADVGGAGAAGTLAKIRAERDALEAQLMSVRAKVEDTEARLAAINAAHPDVRILSQRPGWKEVHDEQQLLLMEAAKIRKKDGALWAKGRQLERATTGGPPKAFSDWKPGDDPKARPFSSGSYSATGVDQARTTLFHEFGHHVHQYLNKAGPRRQFGKPPLEAELTAYFRASMAERRASIPTGYAATNEMEWFAENFALFVMGRRDLVDVGALELIERIFARAY